MTEVTTMCVDATPVERHPELGLWVKREDLCCPGGPNFSKTRGVFAHVARQTADVIGVLDTDHSQGGWAVARACDILGKRCVNFYPWRKAFAQAGIEGVMADHPQWRASKDLGAMLVPLQAGMSAVLYNTAKRDLPRYATASHSYYMMPNALKLPEMITETVAEVRRTTLPQVDTIIVSASSGTIAAGVIRGLDELEWTGQVIVHMGYSRPAGSVAKYIWDKASGGVPPGPRFLIRDERYSYADRARPGVEPPFPCNEFYDLKAFRWWMDEGRRLYGEALLWNIG